MSLVTWAKNNSRALGKLALYGTGGFLIGYPIVVFADNLWRGWPVKGSADNAILVGTGYNPTTGAIETTRTRDAVIRTLLGAGAIYAARKI